MYDNLKIDNQLCFRIYSASRGIIRMYKPLLDKLGITYPQYVTMMVLWEKEKIDFKSLSNILDMKTGTLTPILQKLVAKGYIYKEKNQHDDRKVTIVLSKLGKQIKDEATCIPKEMLENLGLSRDEYLKYNNILDELIQKINNIINLKEV
jgi:DNA-binding MarR family transcriptional regulator